MKLICTLTGAQVETHSDEAAKKLIASGGFAVKEEAKPKRSRKTVKSEK